MVKLGKIDSSEQIIKLIYENENQIVIFFDKKDQDLKGWEILDQYNNKINFSLRIVSKNDIYNKNIFKIPDIN